MSGQHNDLRDNVTILIHACEQRDSTNQLLPTLSAQFTPVQSFEVLNRHEASSPFLQALALYRQTHVMHANCA
jgi:hypothetical protein